METMITSSASQYNDLSDFLAKHSINKNNNTGKSPTHTRIGNVGLNIYPGSFSIPPEELPVFRRLFYEHVFVKGRKEYLTEKQLEDTGPLLVDLDFRYDYEVTKRMHTVEHIQDLIQLYLEEFKNLFVLEDNKTIPIFIMEKPNVNRDADKQITKDGIHIIFGVQMDHGLQMLLRNRIIEQIGDIWELPITNTWDDVLDISISKGCTNWQMYGCQKPGYEAYKISYYTTAVFNSEDNDWIITAKDPKDIDLLNDYKLLSAQYDQHVSFKMNPELVEEHAKFKEMLTAKAKKSVAKGKVSIVFEENTNIELSDIVNYDILVKAINNIMENLKPNEQYVKETHLYTQILPDKYYKPGSHLLNRKVAFALKHTDERLFLSWVMLRSKASDFDYATIPSLYNEWKNHFNKRPDGVTKASIMYWAKQDAYEEYEKIKKASIDQYIEDTIFEAGDWDYAMVLHHLFKDKYVCSSITNKKWYVFNRHRWEKDEGQRLRMAISKDLYELYSLKQSQCLAEAQHFDPSDEQHEKLQRKVKKISEICIRLRKTNDKNNIMREAMEIFYDKDFTKNTDSNPYLMCCSNGVIDFKEKVFRDGYPQDYITISTDRPYVPYDPANPSKITFEIQDFLKTLFPIPSTCRYAFDHLASTLIGVKKEQVFVIYRGSGGNGKTILTELMSYVLGGYKGVVPITLVTDKRSSIGGATPEIMSLKGIRYAVMQEPSKDAVINEGILKELTGGDPLLGRALYCDSEIFIPQFSLAVCTNSLFEIKSNDDGTWRRMKLLDFISKFVSEGESYTDTTPFVFPKDKTLKEKLPIWAPVFFGMLVHRAFETEGEVIDCEEVIHASNKYRQSQDAISGFILDKIVLEENKQGVSGKVLNDVFKEWFSMNYGSRKPPKMSELTDAIDMKFGNKNPKTRKWHNIKIREDEEVDEMEDV